MSFTGTPPRNGGVGLLVTSNTTDANALVVALAVAGCNAESIFVLESGRWCAYIPGAPAVVNSAFPAVVAATTAFFVRARRGDAQVIPRQD